MKEQCNVLCGDASNILEKLSQDTKEQNKYRLIVTSPPYYMHRQYGKEINEIGRERTPEQYLSKLIDIFSKCKNLLTDDGSLFIVIGDTRRNHEKLLIPHRLAIKLIEEGFYFQEDIIWYKKNAISNSSKTSLTQSYEVVLFLSKNRNPFIDIDPIRVQGNEVISGIKRIPEEHELQFEPIQKTLKS